MTLKCLIVDDEPLARRVLEKYIQRIPQLTLSGACSDAFQAGQALQAERADLLFLDIQMPELTGISFLRTLKNPPLVVFTTAFPEYAVEGFELEALDYLLKPISFERFLTAVNKAAARLEQDQKLRSGERQEHLLVRADRKLYQINCTEVLYLQAYGDYVKIATRSGKRITPKARLQEFESRLPAGRFLRVHRSFIVALDAIRYLEGNLLRIGEDSIPVGQSYRKILMIKMEEKSN